MNPGLDTAAFNRDSENRPEIPVFDSRLKAGMTAINGPAAAAN